MVIKKDHFAWLDCVICILHFMIDMLIVIACDALMVYLS